MNGQVSFTLRGRNPDEPPSDGTHECKPVTGFLINACPRLAGVGTPSSQNLPIKNGFYAYAACVRCYEIDSIRCGSRQAGAAVRPNAACRSASPSICTTCAESPAGKFSGSHIE